MPTPTYTPLATITLTSTDSEVVFASIPSSFRDLILIISNSQGLANLRFNSDTAGNYNWVRMWGEGGGGQSSASSNQTSLYTGDGSTAPSMNRIQIMDYSATDKHKSVLARNDYNPGSLNYNAFTVAGRWASNTAINTISISGTTYPVGATFSLYGVAA